jgi:hypothetical protein
MNRIPSDAAGADCARWLAELAQVLDEAQELVNRLAVARGACAEMLDASARLEAARAEVQSLRRGQWARIVKEIHPNWMKSQPWDRALAEQRA